MVWGSVSGGAATKPKDSCHTPLPGWGEEAGGEKKVDKDGGQYSGEAGVVPTTWREVKSIKAKGVEK